MFRGLLGKHIHLLVGGLWLLWLGGLARQLSFAAGGTTEGGFSALLNLYGYIHVTAWGLGWSAMRRLNLALTALETTILSYLLGLGILSSAIALAGFFGWLNASVVFVILAFAGLPAALSAPEAVANLRNVFRASRVFSPTDLYERSLFVLVALIIPVMLAHALTPVWDYDALLYHLEAPRRFLAHGGIYFDQEMMRSAYPYLGEMLFAVGMMFHLDVLSKLIHLTYAVLFILGVYAMGVRFFNRQTALIAAGILVSVPSFILWSTWASIDFAWAGYELWSVYAITRWLTDERQPSRRWLMLAGVMSGFAAGIKYISVPPLLILAALLAWFSRRRLQQSTGETLRALLVFSLSAALAGGGWYLKNLILTGNPVYPLVFGGAGWEPLERQVFNAYMQTFGMGKTPLHLLLLPYNVYAHQDRFSTMPQELIHPLLWLAFLFPFCAKYDKHSFLIIYTMTYFAWWFWGSQVIRFLLPITGFLALFAGAVLEKFPKWAGNALKFSLISGLMIVSLVYHTLTLRNAGAFEYIGGRLSSDAFLRVVVDDYHVKQYIRASLSPAERALFLWDGRGYYCDNRCIADTEQALAVGLAFNSPPPASLARELREKGVTHLMLSLSDANFFVALHDPQGLHRRALEYYQTVFLPACGKPVFQDAGMELFQIDC